MHISKLVIHQFRNIASAELVLAPGFNGFYGHNGSGKTSLLEAIYYLAMAKSFRSHYSRYIIQDGSEAFTLFAQVESAESFKLGLHKPRVGDMTMKYQEEAITTQGEWISKLPVLLCNHDTYQLLDAGPKVRRQFIDWGVFHVKHEFFRHWQIVQKALRQRNSALRAGLSEQDVQAWDQQLIASSLQITALRNDYLAALLPLFKEILGHFLDLAELKIDFYQGWPDDQDFASALKASYSRDRQQGYTRHGPQRADLRFVLGAHPAEEVLSRGQQKVFVAALKLAQGQLLRGMDKPCLYLVDDLPSELDEIKQASLIKQLAKAATQVLVTGITRLCLDPLFVAYPAKMFHVKHPGVIVED